MLQAERDVADTCGPVVILVCVVDRERRFRAGSAVEGLLVDDVGGEAGRARGVMAVETTSSSSGKAFSVTIARGRLSSPSGIVMVFLQKPRM